MSFCCSSWSPATKRRLNKKMKNMHMNRYGWQIALIVSLLSLSALLYYIHYLIFGDAHHIFLYLLGDIAFIPVEVLIVTLIIHQLLTAHEKRAMLKKLNMVVGAFFSEVGTELLRRLRVLDAGSAVSGEKFKVGKDWTVRDFSSAKKFARSERFEIDIRKGDPRALKDFLITKREFLLRLLENPNLLEHEEFTDLLWAVFHLTEELEERRKFEGLPDSDYEHLSGDMKRVYGILLAEWVEYMLHLKTSYPYLFSLAIRTNPFDPDASVILK